MPRKTTPKSKKSTDPDEYKRFLETAKEVEAEDDPASFDRAFKKIARKKTASSPGTK